MPCINLSSPYLVFSVFIFIFRLYKPISLLDSFLPIIIILNTVS